jgi:hypothetical protein
VLVAHQFNHLRKPAAQVDAAQGELAGDQAEVQAATKSLTDRVYDFSKKRTSAFTGRSGFSEKPEELGTQPTA